MFEGVSVFGSHKRGPINATHHFNVCRLHDPFGVSGLFVQPNAPNVCRRLSKRASADMCETITKRARRKNGAAVRTKSIDVNMSASESAVSALRGSS